MKLLAFLFTILISLYACTKTEDINIENLLWEKDITISDLVGMSTDPIIEDDHLFVSKFTSNFLPAETNVTCYDKNNGEEKWVWSDTAYQHPNGVISLFSLDKMIFYDGIIIGNHGSYFVALDAYSGQLLWKNDYGKSFRTSEGILDGELLCATHTGNIGQDLELFRVDIASGLINVDLTFEPVEAVYSLKPRDFVHYNNEDGDRCVALILSHIFRAGYPDMKVKNDFWNYNLDKKEVIFKKENLEDYELNHLYYYDNSLYAHGLSLLKFDIISGEILHEFNYNIEYHNSFSYFEPPYIYNVFNGQETILRKSVLSDGTTIWEKKLGDDWAFNIKAKDDKLYISNSTGGKFYILDKSNGSTLKSMHAPYENVEGIKEDLFFDPYFQVDQKSGYLYTSDYRHMFCFDFNDL